MNTPYFGLQFDIGNTYIVSIFYSKNILCVCVHKQKNKI